MANRANLQLSIDLMKRVREERLPFSLAVWEAEFTRNIANHMAGFLRARYGLSGDLTHPCGTVHCVGGFMMNDPAHNKAGLIRDDGAPFCLLTKLWPWDGGARGYNAMARFWDVSLEKASSIGSAMHYDKDEPATIDNVIARMERLHAE